MFFFKRKKKTEQERENSFARFNRMADNRRSFIESCNAQSCTPEVYAKWLSSYMISGGKVTSFLKSHSWSDFDVAGSDPGRIPSQYDAARIKLLIPREVEVSSNLHKTYSATISDSSYYAREQGDNGIYAFHNGVAWTSETRSIECDPDVIRLLDLPQWCWEKLNLDLSEYAIKNKKSELNSAFFKISDRLDGLDEDIALHISRVQNAKCPETALISLAKTLIERFDGSVSDLDELKASLDESVEILAKARCAIADYESQLITPNREAIASMMQ